MNDNILCLYYSRTGNTKKAMEEVAEALDCECVQVIGRKFVLFKQKKKESAYTAVLAK